MGSASTSDKPSICRLGPKAADLASCSHDSIGGRKKKKTSRFRLANQADHLGHTRPNFNEESTVHQRMMHSVLCLLVIGMIKYAQAHCCTTCAFLARVCADGDMQDCPSQSIAVLQLTQTHQSALRDRACVYEFMLVFITR